MDPKDGKDFMQGVLDELGLDPLDVDPKLAPDEDPDEVIEYGE